MGKSREQRHDSLAEPGATCVKGFTLSHGADQWPAVCLRTRGRVVVQGPVPRAAVVLLQVRLDSLDSRAQLGRWPWRVVARSHGDSARDATGGRGWRAWDLDGGGNSDGDGDDGERWIRYRPLAEPGGCRSWAKLAP